MKHLSWNLSFAECPEISCKLERSSRNLFETCTTCWLSSRLLSGSYSSWRLLSGIFLSYIESYWKEKYLEVSRPSLFLIFLINPPILNLIVEVVCLCVLLSIVSSRLKKFLTWSHGIESSGRLQERVAWELQFYRPTGFFIWPVGKCEQINVKCATKTASTDRSTWSKMVMLPQTKLYRTTSVTPPVSSWTFAMQLRWSRNMMATSILMIHQC